MDSALIPTSIFHSGWEGVWTWGSGCDEKKSHPIEKTNSSS